MCLDLLVAKQHPQASTNIYFLLCLCVFTPRALAASPPPPHRPFPLSHFNSAGMRLSSFRFLLALCAIGLTKSESTSLYREKQATIIRDCLDHLLNQKDTEVRLHLHRLNSQASQHSLIGPYVTPEIAKILTKNMLAFTQGWLGLPFPIPGNAVFKAWRAHRETTGILTKIITEAKRCAVETDFKKRCVLDFWISSMDAAGPDAILDVPTMAEAIHNFLFASQDATTSALVWAICMVSEHPEVCLEQVVSLRPLWSFSASSNVIQRSHCSPKSLPKAFKTAAFVRYSSRP